MFRKFIVAIIVLATWSLSAQNGTSSPYSYFGIGDESPGSTVENQMMGGISTYADSIHINLKNPAAYSKLRLTTYTAGISQKRMDFKSADGKESSSNTGLDYLALGVPISGQMAIGFGIMPYSIVDYNLESTITNGDESTLSNSYSGDGGLNRVFFSLGCQIAKNISLGASINYNFGTINKRRVQTSSDIQFGTLDERESQISGYDFNYSLNYNPKITARHTLYTMVGLDTRLNLNSQNSQSVGSFSAITGQEIEVIDINLDAQGLKFTDIRVPTTTTLGLGIGENLKWFLGAEYSFQALADYKNIFFKTDNLEYNDASTITIGGHYIPQYTSFTSYFKRITYRAGIRITNTGLAINNQDINDFGITFGTGLPLGRSLSNLNVGFEIGKRGTLEANLIQENYFKINVGLSLNDKWFYKRKIN